MSQTASLPPSPSDPAHILLDALANPGEARKALEKLVEERKQIEKLTAKYHEVVAAGEAELKKAKTEADRATAANDAAANKTIAESEKLRTTLASIERGKEEISTAQTRLDQKTAVLTQREHALEEREKALEPKERAVNEREMQNALLAKKLDERQAELSAREKQFADDKAGVDKWMANLKPPWGR
jgi:chromosome segregation ATPase